MQYKTIFLLFISSVLIGCGSSSDNNEKNLSTDIEVGTEISDNPTDDGSETEPQNNQPSTDSEAPAETYTGMFLDSAVEGISYQTATQSGTTNALGQFSFQSGELITFSIGNIDLPTIPAELYITPLEVFETEDINDSQVVNLLRLLQSLDADGNASNGIEITADSHQAATNLTLNIDFNSDNFESQVTDLITQSNVTNTSLISATMAIDHFQLTLDELSGTTISGCSSTHEKIGYSGSFSTLAHNVSGLATIIDDCTIEVTEFTYDGGGPEVFFYGAIDHQYAGQNAFALGEKLTGTVYNNGKVTLQLPQGTNLDDLTGLSVWCVDFDANFGQMKFTP